MIEVNSSQKALSLMIFGGEAIGVLYDLRWMLVLIVVLVLSDLWFGVSDSLHKKMEFRFSRAGRRTCNKLVDYLTYLLVGTLIGLGITETIGWATHTTTAAIGLGCGCFWEIDSIIGHVCSLHGVKPISVKRLIISILKSKNEQLGEAVEEVIEGDKTKEK